MKVIKAEKIYSSDHKTLCYIPIDKITYFEIRQAVCSNFVELHIFSPLPDNKCTLRFKDFNEAEEFIKENILKRNGNF